MANVPSSVVQEPPTTQREDSLRSDDQGLGTLAIILIVILVLIVFGVIGFSIN